LAEHPDRGVTGRPVWDKLDSGVDPTDVAFVVSHIRQLGPTVRATADAIAVV
jgi:hypothetical protein